ncbi:lipopolysaccharide biosynthesis protein [Sphingomonas sp. 1P06PA]|uniref:lipopolysaccharide biosynthesis protein n=1 Tax=Sphingomonas sp. 1P06PA TaxID=554121 RepID=UPI0039A65D2B
MIADPADDPPHVSRADVARGAGLATLARLGALIEVIAQPVYTWLFGIATYGVYTVLWAAVNIAENIVDLSMTQALQRVVPTESESDAHAAVRFALLVSVGPALLIALAATLSAGSIAALISAAPADRVTLPLAVALFAWALPLWTFIEVSTAAARARRAFGPEIRLRIFWEQIARLAFAVALFAIGVGPLGLIVAHLASLALTAALSARLLLRYFDGELLLRAPLPRRVRGALLATGFATLPAAVTRRLFNDLPAVVLNLMLPGARGATAAGLFGIARKIASIPLIVRQAFQYVMAPLASAQARADRAGIAPLYRFATRVSTALVIPVAGVLLLLADDILSVFAPEARAALPLLIILVLARAGEAIVGAATPVVEMTGHRALPLLNSAIGLAAWALLSIWLVPPMAGTGMAIAVAVGTVLVAWTAAIELRLTEGLPTFDRHSLLGAAIAIAAVAAMWAIGLLLAPLGAPVRAAGLLLLLPAAAWIALRFGLDPQDRAALGKAGRRMRLA